METIRAAGAPVAYVRQGRGAPLLMFHNGGTSHAIWRHTAAAFEDCFETFAPDLAGFGASATPDERLSLDGYAAMVGALVDTHQLAPVSLVGNCMGSAISQRLEAGLARDGAAAARSAHIAVVGVATLGT